MRPPRAGVGTVAVGGEELEGDLCCGERRDQRPDDANRFDIFRCRVNRGAILTLMILALMVWIGRTPGQKTATPA